VQDKKVKHMPLMALFSPGPKSQTLTPFPTEAFTPPTILSTRPATPPPPSPCEQGSSRTWTPRSRPSPLKVWRRSGQSRRRRSPREVCTWLRGTAYGRWSGEGRGEVWGAGRLKPMCQGLTCSLVECARSLHDGHDCITCHGIVLNQFHTYIGMSFLTHLNRQLYRINDVTCPQYFQDLLHPCAALCDSHSLLKLMGTDSTRCQ